MRRFTTHCDAAFAPLLSRHGFTLVARKVDRSLAEHVYRAGERYVKVTATDDPRDGTSQCQVLLGEGSSAWPETDWNTVALWQLGRASAPRRRRPSSANTSFAGVDGLGEALRSEASHPASSYPPRVCISRWASFLSARNGTRVVCRSMPSRSSAPRSARTDQTA
jgi:hypothetical protein